MAQHFSWSGRSIPMIDIGTSDYPLATTSAFAAYSQWAVATRQGPQAPDIEP